MSGEEIVFGADAHIIADTKATSGTTETTSLTSFYVSAVTGSAGSESSAFASTQFTQIPGSNPAAYKGQRNWPASDQSYKFYASNVPLTFAAGGTTVSATNTTDVVCAYLTDGTYKTKNTLTFDHIFARLGRVDVAAEAGYTVSDISIRMTPKTGGTYNLRTGAGQTDGTGWSSVTTGSSTVVANKTGANANDVYLVPGSYTLTATWTATQSGSSVTYTNKEVDIVIVGGKTNVVSVVLGGEIILGIDLEEYCEYNYKDNLDYLTFYCDQAGTIGWICSDASVAKTIQYSKDQGATWTSITSTTSGATISVSAGDIVWFKASNSSYGTIYDCNQFTLTNKAHVYGNVNSLTGNNTSVGECCFSNLFSSCGSNLYTYAGKKIILPATTLADYCYSNMFDSCSSLTTAPELPATTLAVCCYQYMFHGCTSLTTVPKLPATTLASYCYSYMFKGCASLTTAPELPATTLAGTCYSYMFQGCTSLTTVPELPATTLASQCYNCIFSGCTSLTSAPELPATTLASQCYSYMFRGCTSLTTAPELPATTLASQCYRAMFQNCSSLTTAPELPATTLVTYCYRDMFQNCSSLNYIKALFTTTPSSTYTSGWVSGVAATGTFVKNRDATWNVIGGDGVPTGWTVRTASAAPNVAPIGRFTINSRGDQVGFAPGNLQCTIQSALAVDSQVYIGTDWRFATNQWDYFGNTDSANTFTVGKKMDFFGWVGESASYDTYGLCSNTGTNNAYFGTGDSDALKTDWGDIPGVISACGDGWRSLDIEEWGYVFDTRTGTAASTIGSTADVRYAMATIRTDETGVNGIILFPDGGTFATSEFTTLGTVNGGSGWDSCTKCTAAQWAALEVKGCVFLPAAGNRSGTIVSGAGIRGYYWSSSLYDASIARSVDFSSGNVYLQDGNYQNYGFSVRLAKRVN